MIPVDPIVRLIARPSIDWQEIIEHFKSIGYGGEWADKRLEDNHAETLVEFAGRTCYRSFEVGANKNITKIREDRSSYLENILKSGHGSVLEHVNWTFLVHDVSRVLTHELVRHRVGIAVSQESLRFVRLDDLRFWIPPWATEDPELAERCQIMIAQCEQFQLWMAQHFKLDDPSVRFEEKKQLTSFMRRFAPMGLATTMVWTANCRAIRHVMELRSPITAEEEIILFAKDLGLIMLNEAPELFGDYEWHEEKGWTTKYRKV